MEKEKIKNNKSPFRNHTPIIERDDIRYFNDSYNLLVSKILLPSKKDIIYDAKILITGMVNVGKKTLLRWFEDGRFVIYDKPYMGGSFINIETIINHKRLKLDITTTQGQERFGIYLFKKILDVYLIVYDVGKRESFNLVNVILNQINSLENKNNIQPLIFLVGNKIDNKNEREVNTDEGKKFAKENNLFFYEISVKSGKNCYEFFSYLNLQILIKYYKRNENENKKENNNESIIKKIINFFGFTKNN